MPVSPSPLRIDRIDHILLIVGGMSESLAFYEGALGCTVASRLPRYGMVELRAGASHLDLVDVTDQGGAWAKPTVADGRNIDHFALRLKDGDATALRNHLAEHGIPIVEERTESDGSASFYVRDPSGNTIELIAAGTPAVQA
jgi:glyoxylase I family protein